MVSRASVRSRESSTLRCTSRHRDRSNHSGRGESSLDWTDERESSGIDAIQLWRALNEQPGAMLQLHSIIARCWEEKLIPPESSLAPVVCHARKVQHVKSATQLGSSGFQCYHHQPSAVWLRYYLAAERRL